MSVTIVHHQHIQTQTRWGVNNVLAAIDAHERGDFRSSAMLVDHYGRDERIAVCTEDRISSLTGEDTAAFELEKSDVNEVQSAALAADLSVWWHEVMTDSWLRQCIQDVIHMGLSISWVAWEMTADEWRPVSLTRFHLSCVRWDETKLCYVAATRDHGLIDIKPGDPNWLVVAPGGWSHSWMRGAVRSLGMHYLMRGWDFRDFARYNERHGMPILKIFEPTGSQDKEEKDRFFAALRQMGSGGTMRLPRGDEESESYDVEFLEAKSRTFDAFVKFGDMLSTAIAVRILGQNMTTEVQGGSFAAATALLRVKQSVIRGDASSVGAALRESIVMHYGRANVVNSDPRSAPWPRWRIVMPEDLQAEAMAIQGAYQAMPGIIESGADVDANAFARKFGVPLMEGAEPKAVPPKAEPKVVTENEIEPDSKQVA
jgi:phage gp29-like protein